MVTSSGQLIRRIVSEVSSLEPLYHQHLEDYDELLVHVFMSDIARFVISELAVWSSAPSALGVLEILDEAFRSEDRELVNLISVSFLENLDSTEHAAMIVIDRLPEALALGYARNSGNHSDRKTRYSH